MHCMNCGQKITSENIEVCVSCGRNTGHITPQTMRQKVVSQEKAMQQEKERIQNQIVEQISDNVGDWEKKMEYIYEPIDALDGIISDYTKKITQDVPDYKPLHRVDEGLIDALTKNSKSEVFPNNDEVEIKDLTNNKEILNSPAPPQQPAQQPSNNNYYSNLKDDTDIPSTIITKDETFEFQTYEKKPIQEVPYLYVVSAQEDGEATPEEVEELKSAKEAIDERFNEIQTAKKVLEMEKEKASKHFENDVKEYVPNSLNQNQAKAQAPNMQAQPQNMQAKAPNMQAQAPNMQAQAQNMQGQAPNMQGQAPFMQGQAPFMQGQAPFMQGQAPFMQGQAPFMQGQPPYMQRQNPYPQAPFIQGQNPYPQAKPPNMQGQNPYPQANNPPYMQGQNPYPQATPQFVQGQNPYPQANPQFVQGQNPYPQANPQFVQGQNPYPQANPQFVQGQNSYPQANPQFMQGQNPYPHGQGQNNNFPQSPISKPVVDAKKENNMGYDTQPLNPSEFSQPIPQQEELPKQKKKKKKSKEMDLDYIPPPILDETVSKTESSVKVLILSFLSFTTLFAICIGIFMLIPRDFKIEDGILIEYTGRDKVVQIPNKVDKIGDGVFENLSFIEEIIIPDTVTSIGDLAFANCTSLKNVELHQNIVHFGENAVIGVPLFAGYTFEGSKLVEYVGEEADIVIPDFVTVIGQKAFFNNDFIETVTLPSGLRKIEEVAFSSCDLLQTVVIPNGTTIIENSAFSGSSNLTNVTIASTVNFIGSDAFSGTEWYNNLSEDFNIYGNNVLIKYAGNDTDIVIPENVTFIGNAAFRNNETIKTVSIPSSVTEIGYSAFSGCTRLENVVINEGVSVISEGAFLGCPNLRHMEYPSTITSIKRMSVRSTQWYQNSYDKFVVVGDSTLVRYNGEDVIFEIPAEIKRISDEAFGTSPLIEAIILPNSIEFIDEYAFTGLEHLEKIYCVQGSYVDEYFNENPTVAHITINYEK